MSEEVIVRLGAPTLAGIKTGSLFTCAYTSRKSVEESLRRLNRCFAPKGLCLLPLRYSEKNVLLYLFRPAELLRSTDRTVLDIAGQFGYDNASKFARAFRSVIGVSPNAYRGGATADSCAPV